MLYAIISQDRDGSLDDRLHAYLVAHSVRETALMRDLRELTGRHELARMQIAPEQGQFMALLESFTTFPYLFGMEYVQDEAQRQQSLDFSRKYIQVAGWLGVKTILLVPGAVDVGHQVQRRHWIILQISSHDPVRVVFCLGKLVDVGDAGYVCEITP